MRPHKQAALATFRHDVAVSYVGHDALTVHRLVERLQPRVGSPIYAAWEHHKENGDGDPAEAVTRALGAESRTVVVLHQLLWGETPSTRIEREAIEARIARQGGAFLLVVPLEPMGALPPWLPPSAIWPDLARDGLAGAVEAITAALAAAGGSVLDAANGSAAAPERETSFAQERNVLLRAPRALAAAHRELDALVAEITTGLAERQLLPDAEVRLHRTPDRFIVQAGDVGLSLSWLPSRTDNGVGMLLVIQWKGTISLPGERSIPGHQAKPVHEYALQLDAASHDSYGWSSEGSGACSYRSRDLARQCVDLLARRVSPRST